MTARDVLQFLIDKANLRGSSSPFTPEIEMAQAVLAQPDNADFIVVKFSPNDRGNPPGKLADAELHFHGGLLDGLKLIGFAIWERKGGSIGKNVTFPARSYSVNGERRSFALLRPRVDATAQNKIRDLIVAAWTDFENRGADLSDEDGFKWAPDGTTGSTHTTI